MYQYRFAIAFISIIFLVLAIADMHRSDLSAGCYNAEGQLVACSSLSSPRATQAPEIAPTYAPMQGAQVGPQISQTTQIGAAQVQSSGR